MADHILFEDKKIFYRRSGEGPVITLLHGFLEDMGMWDHFAEHLSEQFQVLTIDLPGFGRSECLGDVHQMGDLARVVNAVMTALQITNCLVVGHSMGGYAALDFAKMFPVKTAGLCLFHSHAMEDTPEAKHNRDRAIELVRSDRNIFIHNFFPDLFAPENVETFKNEIDKMHEAAMNTSPEAIIAALEGMKQRKSRLDVLINAAFPVFFILGKQDSRVSFEKTLAQAALPANGEVLMLKDVGHMGFLEARHTTLNALKGFAFRTFNIEQ